jgi:hypothetical protein
MNSVQVEFVRKSLDPVGETLRAAGLLNGKIKEEHNQIKSVQQIITVKYTE